MHDKRQGPSQRTLKVGEQIKRALGTYLMRESFWEEGLKNVHLTISEVRMSPDLKTARVYILPLNSKECSAEQMKDIIEALSHHAHEMRREIGKFLTMKYMPKLHFIYDDTIEEATKIDNLLKADNVKRDLEG